jgi:hypothetical protein
MNRLLRAGDIFRFLALPQGCVFKGRIVYADDKWCPEPRPDFGVIRLDYDCKVTAIWTERKPEGWERKRETDMSELLLLDYEPGESWRVLETEMTGGGTAMGPHDVFPDGHLARCERTRNPGQELRLYQTGCFIGMAPPELLELVE